MKKFSLTLILFLTTVFVYGQTADSIAPGRLDIGFSASPEYCYRILKTDAANNWLKESYDTMEVSKYSFTAGLSLIYRIHQQFSIGSGIILADRGERTRNYTLKPVNNYINHYYYLDVPLKINYYFLRKKVYVFATAGIAANIYLNSNTRTSTGNTGETAKLDASPELSRIGVSMVAGLGIDCPLTERWYFKLEPQYRRSLTPVANSNLKKYFYSAGLNLSFLYRF